MRLPFVRVLLLSCCFFLLFAGIQALAQADTGAVTGQVTCDDGNVPARNASVGLTPLSHFFGDSEQGFHGAGALTDLSGAYEFPAMAPGTYIVSVRLPGYSDDLDLALRKSAQLSPDERKQILSSLPQVTVRVGSSARRDITLHRAGSISGHVTFDAGGTAYNMVVTATLVDESFVSHASGSSAQANAFTQTAVVDDRGRYRVIGLPPGTYRVSTRLQEDFLQALVVAPEHIEERPERKGVANLTVYAPETWKASEAKLIRVADGDEVADEEIVVPTAKLHAIDGVVTRNGTPVGRVSLSLNDQGQQQESLGGAVSMPDGSFRFDWVPPGTYTLTARAMKGNSAGMHDGPVKLTVEVLDHDVSEVELEVGAQKSEPK